MPVQHTIENCTAAVVHKSQKLCMRNGTEGLLFNMDSYMGFMCVKLRRKCQKKGKGEHIYTSANEALNVFVIQVN